MFDDLNNLESNSVITTDVCIIGTGPAGISLARTFIDTNFEILLLESGTFQYETDTQNLYKGKINKDLPPVPLHASRLRYLGGTSNHWTGHCGPFKEVDFKKREWIANSGWPISLIDLEPYYRSAHDVIKLGPYNYDAKNWTKNNSQVFDFKETPFVNSMLQQAPQRFGPFYKKELEGQENIRVLLHANLSLLKTDRALKNIDYIEIKSLKGVKATVKAKKFVLACGGVENARLMLHSKLDEITPNIGNYYSFHPRLITSQLELKQPVGSETSPYLWQDLQETFVKLFIDIEEEIQVKDRLPNNAFNLMNIANSENIGYTALKKVRNAAQGDHPLSNIYQDIATVFRNFESVASQLKNRHVNNPRYKLAVMTYIDQIPNKDSRITLSRELDALGVPKPHVQWNYLKEDLESTIEFNNKFAVAVGASGIGRLHVDPKLSSPKHFEKLIRESSGGGHQMGTTRMSNNKTKGVVDKNLKVHNINNLYCAGSSVFPTFSWINPTMTIVALSLRLGDHLIDQLGKSNESNS